MTVEFGQCLNRLVDLLLEDVHNRIYRKAKILLEPGSMFDPDKGAGFECICLPSPRSVIREVFERIAVQF
ncbi:hypothetical protein FACS189450_07690 [Spirochaetia bacterium]|nr:hypothetical protein FACS189450_07690 [Spirochaetia bacterium]GHU95842.1 hypothetical protein FACS189479_09510 [Spirochaetia bacterium]